MAKNEIEKVRPKERALRSGERGADTIHYTIKFREIERSNSVRLKKSEMGSKKTARARRETRLDVRELRVRPDAVTSRRRRRKGKRRRMGCRPWSRRCSTTPGFFGKKKKANRGFKGAGKGAPEDQCRADRSERGGLEESRVVKKRALGK